MNYYFQVIYALNTKNDEHDAVVQQIKEQHEEELQQLLKETKEKVAQYRDKLNAESAQNMRIEQLETNLIDHESLKHRHLNQFEAFKGDAEEREMRLKAEHAQKMLELSQDVLHTKKDFEEKLRQFEAWKDSINDEHNRMIGELQSRHEGYIEEVRNQYRDKNNDWISEVKKVEDKYKLEVESLQTKCKEIEEHKCQLKDEFEAKLEKARLFYEKELEAVMQMNNISSEEANRMLQDEKDKLTKDFLAQEAELRKQINSVLSQLTDKEDEVEDLAERLKQLQKNQQEQDSSSEGLLKQV